MAGSVDDRVKINYICLFDELRAAQKSTTSAGGLSVAEANG